MTRSAILTVDNLSTHFHTRDGVVRAVDGVSFDLFPGETLSIVGESGCGKSVTALSILRLLAMPPAKFETGRIVFDGRDLLALNGAAMRRVRGNEISMIFQEPMTSLNPVLKVGRQIAESITLHQGVSARTARSRTLDMLDQVGIPDPAKRANDYPHQLSGGQRQRVMIAMALACNPKVLIADEPTTALDVTVQAQILALMGDLKRQTGTAIILITHDLGVVAEAADRVVVMYAGRKVEEAPVRDLFRTPRHPYTHGLMGAVPRLHTTASGAASGAGGGAGGGARRRLPEIAGLVPALAQAMPGCGFAPRCRLATDRCRRQAPALERATGEHWAACWETDRLREAARA